MHMHSITGFDRIPVYYPGFLCTCLLPCTCPGGVRCPMSLSPGWWPSSLRLLCLGEILTCRCLEAPGLSLSPAIRELRPGSQSLEIIGSIITLNVFAKTSWWSGSLMSWSRERNRPCGASQQARPHVLTLPSLVYVRFAHTRSLDMRDSPPVWSLDRWLF